MNEILVYVGFVVLGFIGGTLLYIGRQLREIDASLMAMARLFQAHVLVEDLPEVTRLFESLREMRSELEGWAEEDSDD